MGMITDKIIDLSTTRMTATIVQTVARGEIALTIECATLMIKNAPGRIEHKMAMAARLPVKAVIVLCHRTMPLDEYQGAIIIDLLLRARLLFSPLHPQVHRLPRHLLLRLQFLLATLSKTIRSPRTIAPFQ